MDPSPAQTLADRQLELGKRPAEAVRAASPPTDTPVLEAIAPALRAVAAEVQVWRPIRNQPIERLSFD